MGEDVRLVRAHYDACAEKEWERLAGFTFEFEITRRIMEQTLRPGMRILDIGGGPGRYSIYFAAQGYDVTLVDLSPGNIALAKRKAEEAGTPLRAHACDARDLSALPLDKEYDAVFVMGPLYHLFSEEDRLRVLNQAKARLAPGGTLFASFIGLFAGISYYLSECPAEIVNEPAPNYFDCVKENRSWHGTAFTEAYFIHPSEVRPLMEKAGLRTLRLFGQEGIAACNLLALTTLPENARDFWLKLCLDNCDKPEYLALSSHLMCVCQKAD